MDNMEQEKQKDYLIYIVWVVILVGIGFAAYYGIKSFNNNDALEEVEKEKSLLPADIKKTKKEDYNTSNTTTKKDNTTTKKNNSNNATNKSNNSNNSTTNSNSSNTNTNNGNNNTNTNANANTNTNSNQSNTNNNSSNTNNNNQGTTNIKTLVSTGTEERTEETTKYGTKVTKIETYSVRTYSDNTTERTLTRTNYSFDRSNYHDNVNELASEAQSVLNQNYSDYEIVNNLINEYRTTAGVQPLILNRELCYIATVRAMERALAFEPYNIEHKRPNGSGFETIFQESLFAGFNHGIAYGENVAAAGTTGSTIPNDVYPAAKVARSWYNSQGHRENFLQSNYNITGIGAYQLGNTKYWVQIFIQRN